MQSSPQAGSGEGRASRSASPPAGGGERRLSGASSSSNSSSAVTPRMLELLREVHEWPVKVSARALRT